MLQTLMIVYSKFSNNSVTSPESNLRRVHHSSADKTSIQIANYWDRTALACWQWDLGHAQIWPPRSTALLLLSQWTRVLCYVFLHKFLFNPHFDLEPDYITRKGIRHRIHVICIRKYCQLFTHKSIVDHYAMLPFKTIGLKFGKLSETMPKTAPSPWGMWTSI